MRRFMVPALFGAFLLWVMFFREAPPRAIGQSFYALGTQFTIKLRHADFAQAEQLFFDIRARLDDFNRRWHAWEGSELAELNQQLNAEGAAAIPPELQAGFAQARQLAIASGGLFDPAIAPLVKLWQFDQAERPDGPPPHEADVAQQLANTLPFSQMPGDGQYIQASPGNWLDFGAFAKGVAVNEVVQMLRDAGVEHATVNGGGDLKVIGNFGPRNWRIGIVHPREDGALAIVDVPAGDAIFTSGDYERFFFWPPGVPGAGRYHHILDPRTGYPAEGLISVTVLHEDAAVADAAATALLIAGEDWPQVAGAMGVDRVLVVDAELNVQMTAAMQPRVEILPSVLQDKVQVVAE